MAEQYFTTSSGHKLCYYEYGKGENTFVFIHAQGTDSSSYFDVAKKLQKKNHVILVDCYGHGKSEKNRALYRLEIMGGDFEELIAATTKLKITLVGHSSGGLIAAYIAAHSDLCERLILEDPPFFASQGERRFSTYNYVDLSTVCHQYLEEGSGEDFVTYYFANQYAWNFFPEASREKIRDKMVQSAASYRKTHPDKDLKVMFWPKAALEGFKGMANYDPNFGESFYSDSFHAHIDYTALLQSIRCKTVFLKAKTNIQSGLQMCALNDDDVNLVAKLIPDCTVIQLDSGHGVHTEKKRAFLKTILRIEL